jgi:large subunit ribosomal protein L20
MVRVTNGRTRHAKHKRVRKAARGYRGGRSKLVRTAKVALLRAGRYAYRDRRAKKREMRALWIVRLNAACRMRGLRYGQFLNGLKRADVAIDRKQLSELAIRDPGGFDAVVATAKAALGA